MHIRIQLVGFELGKTVGDEPQVGFAEIV